METITINTKNAREALKKADENLKSVLSQLLGISLAPEKWQDIKTFEDACLIIKPTENQQILLNYNGQDKDMIAAVAMLKLTIVSRAMNYIQNGGKEWKPDWTNSNEYKYYPWLKYLAGSGFSDYDFRYVHSHTTVGSRLCFMTSDMARYAATQFKDLYNDLFTL